MLPGILTGALLVYVILVGGSETGQFLTSFQVLNGVIGALLVALWIVSIRRGGDAVDRFVVGGLILFLVACVASQYPRQAFDAATAALTWAAAFGLGRRLLAVPRYRLLCWRLLGVCGLVLSLSFAAIWGAIWMEWMRRIGGVPPLDLALPAHIYRHYYVVAMLLAALLPASVFLLADRVMRVPAAATIALSALLTLMSGSRSVWLGLAVAGVAALALRKPPRRVVLAVSAALAGAFIVALVAGIAGPAASRLLAGGTVSYRLDIWKEALALWASSPVSGVGPGSMGIGLTLSDLTSNHAFINRHADNAYVQLAAEAGALGLAGGALLIAGIIRGAKWSAPGGPVAAVGLVLLGTMSLTNNPTDSPNLAALIVCYAALLAPRRPEGAAGVDHQLRHSMTLRAGTWAAALVVAAAVASVNLAALFHSAARTEVSAGRLPAATDRLRAAILLDPSMGLYHRERGVLLGTEDVTVSIRHLRAALGLNPADVTAWRALALELSQSGDDGGAADAALQATEIRPLSAENWVILALVSEGEERTAAAAEALSLAPWLAGSPAWPDELTTPSEIRDWLLEAADVTNSQVVLRDVMAAVWLRALTGSVDNAPTDIVSTALYEVLTCDPAAAREAYDMIGDGWAGSTPGIVGRILLERLAPSPSAEAVVSIASLQQPALGAAARGSVAPYSAAVGLVEDPQLYRRVGIGPAIETFVIPRAPDALGAWLSDPVEAAARSMPGSALADGCS